MMAMIAPTSGRMAEQNKRLRVRLERLQRLLDTAGAFEGAGKGRPIVSVPGSDARPIGGAPSIGDLEEAQTHYVGEHDPRRRLLPYPGHANASASEVVSACIGLNLVGTPPVVWRNIVQQFQKTLDGHRGHTFVCVTDETDTGYFIQRGITFEYIGYSHRLDDPDWQKYFQLNLDLLKKKYGIGEFVTIAGDQSNG